MKAYWQIVLLTGVFAFFSCNSKQNSEKKMGSASPDSIASFAPSTAIEKGPIENGMFEEKYPSGILKIKGEYINGRRHGTWLSFYPDGKIWSEGVYKNGIRDGIAKTFHPNGNKNYEGYYTNGNESGVWKFYDEAGNFIKEINYDKP